MEILISLILKTWTAQLYNQEYDESKMGTASCCPEDVDNLQQYSLYTVEPKNNVPA